MDPKTIISQLPYSHPFLFVDELSEINSEGVTGSYYFPEDSYFYKGHFKEKPVTPGVILTECMAQIGVVCLGVFLLSAEGNSEQNDYKDAKIAMSSTDVDFYLPVFPGEKVQVTSKKEYFRFNKLKCSIEMFNENGKLVCRGKIAGMVFLK